MRINEAAVHRILDEEDIEGLVASRTPADEYEPEVARISGALGWLSEPEFVRQRVAQIVADVWHQMFGPFDDEQRRRRELLYQRVASRILQVHEHP
jgi:hypothetical protein